MALERRRRIAGPEPGRATCLAARTADCARWPAGVPRRPLSTSRHARSGCERGRCAGADISTASGQGRPAPDDRVGLVDGPVVDPDRRCNPARSLSSDRRATTAFDGRPIATMRLARDMPFTGAHGRQFATTRTVRRARRTPGWAVRRVGLQAEFEPPAVGGETRSALSCSVARGGHRFEATVPADRRDTGSVPAQVRCRGRAGRARSRRGRCRRRSPRPPRGRRRR